MKKSLCSVAVVGIVIALCCAFGGVGGNTGSAPLTCILQSDCSGIVTNGQQCWNTLTHKFYIGNGTIAVAQGTGTSNLALGETNSTAYRGDRGKTAYDHSQITSGNPHGTTKTDIGLGNVTNVQQMPLSYLDVNGTLAANSDTKVASQKAVKTYAAPLASPAFTGTPTSPAASAATNNTQIATTAFVASTVGYFRQILKGANATLTCSEIASTEISVNGTTTPIALTVPHGCGGSWGRPSFIVNNARTGAYITKLKDTGSNTTLRLVSSNATKSTATVGWSASVLGNQIACKESMGANSTVRVLICTTIGTTTGNNATAH